MRLDLRLIWERQNFFLRKFQDLVCSGAACRVAVLQFQGPVLLEVLILEFWILPVSWEVTLLAAKF